jgi:DHA2 family multidrug resistance protein
MHSELAGHVTPFNRALGINAPGLMLNPQMPSGLQALNGIITRRAAEVAFANDFLLMFYLSLPVLLIIWLMRRPDETADLPAPEPVE